MLYFVWYFAKSLSASSAQGLHSVVSHLDLPDFVELAPGFSDKNVMKGVLPVLLAGQPLVVGPISDKS